MEKAKVCCICGKRFKGYGNNPEPVSKTGTCCDRCNEEKVVPARIVLLAEIRRNMACNQK